jgi:hypothetical protein
MQKEKVPRRARVGHRARKCGDAQSPKVLTFRGRLAGLHILSSQLRRLCVELADASAQSCLEGREGRSTYDSRTDSLTCSTAIEPSRSDDTSDDVIRPSGGEALHTVGCRREKEDPRLPRVQATIQGAKSEPSQSAPRTYRDTSVSYAMTATPFSNVPERSWSSE